MVLPSPPILTSQNAPEPTVVYKEFLELLEIPRGSGNTSAVSQYLIKWGGKHNFVTKVDAVGNVLITVPATSGYESVPSLALQGHMDMVCVATPGIDHDFVQDRIVAYIENLPNDSSQTEPHKTTPWLTTLDRTTLGADNGIGWAMMASLAVDPKGIHGPLELLMTVDEETDMGGAQAMSDSWLSSRYMINLDDEDEAKLCTGSAGGAKRRVVLQVKRRSVMPGAWRKMELFVHGLEGGHSGDNISLPTGNAIKWVARILAHVGFPLILSLRGGSADNAIPSECKAEILVALKKADKVESNIKSFFQLLLDEYPREQNAVLDLKVEASQPNQDSDEFRKIDAISGESSKRMVDVLLTLPHGVCRMSQAVEGLVETSISLGVCVLDIAAEEFSVQLLARSAINSQLSATVDVLRAMCDLLETCKLEKNTLDFPGWKPQVEGNTTLEVLKKSFGTVFGYPPEVYAIHAGLECGLVKQKYPSMQVVSTGPTVRNPHSPQERVDIDSVRRVYEAVKLGLELFAKRDWKA